MKDKVIHLGDYTGNGTMMSPEQALESALEDHAEGGRCEQSDKVIAISLKDADGEYTVSFTQAGMTMSQILALLEVTKQICLEQMGY